MMDKLFVDAYKKLIKEDWGEQGINYQAIAAAGKAYAGAQKGSTHPDNPNWYDQNIVDIDMDFDKYEQIVKDIRYDKYTLQDILKNIKFFLKDKKRRTFLQVYLNDLEIVDAHGVIMSLIGSMLEMGLTSFISQRDYEYIKVFNYMEMTLQADQNMSLLDQTTIDLEKELGKLGILGYITEEVDFPQNIPAAEEMIDAIIAKGMQSPALRVTFQDWSEDFGRLYWDHTKNCAIFMDGALAAIYNLPDLFFSNGDNDNNWQIIKEYVMEVGYLTQRLKLEEITEKEVMRRAEREIGRAHV